MRYNRQWLTDRGRQAASPRAGVGGRGAPARFIAGVRLQRLSKVRRRLPAAAISLCLAAACGRPAPPLTEEVEMVTGSYRTVADGRAVIQIGEYRDLKPEGAAGSVDAVEVEVSCAEARQVVATNAAEPSEEVCRVRVELVEITGWQPLTARLIVRWDADK